jgi:hypothetical protein
MPRVTKDLRGSGRYTLLSVSSRRTSAYTPIRSHMLDRGAGGTFQNACAPCGPASFSGEAAEELNVQAESAVGFSNALKRTVRSYSRRHFYVQGFVTFLS